MLENTLEPTELLREPLELKKRLTTFSFSYDGDYATLNIVGCFHLEPVKESFEFVRGEIRIGSKNYTVYDKQAMKDGIPKDITEETCIVLLDEHRSFYAEGTAIIVDNTAELLSLLDEKNSNLVTLEM